MEGIVEYSNSSESGNEENTENEVKQNGRLPNLLVNEDCQEKMNDEDDPVLHDGKIRAIKHERGNWATFIYAPVPTEDLIGKIQQEIVEFLDRETGLKVQKINASSVHISLTKLLILRHHWIDAFVDKVTQRIEDVKRLVDLNDSLRMSLNQKLS